MHINDLHSKQDVYKYFDKFDSDKDLEIDLKKEASKIPSEDRKLLQAMDKDHNGKVSLKEFLTSVQAQMGVSKSPSAASKLGIVSRSNIDAMDNPVIKVLKGFYDVLTGPGLVAQEVVPAVTAPQTPAKTVKTVALPAGTTKPTEVVKTADKISESILPKFDFYLSTSADPRALKTNQTRVGVRYEDLPNKDLSSRLTLMQNYGDLRFTFDNRRAENLNNFEKSLKGDKADSDSLNGNVVSANSPAFGGVLRGAVHKENPFVSRWDSQNFYRSGASFFGDKDTFTYYGPALTFGGELNKFNAAAVSFHAGTALDTKSKNVSIGSQNQYSLNAEYLHEMEGFSEFILRFSVGATAAITQRRTNVTTSNSASAAVTGATGSAPTTPAQRNPFFIDNQLDYDESARHWGVSPKVSLEGNHKDWKLNLEGDLQKYRAYQKSAAQNNFETMGRVLLSFEKPLGDFVIRVAYGYGEIGRQTETRANYYNAILYQQNAPIRKENAEIDEKNKKLPLNQKIEHKDYITLAGINDSKVVDAIDHTRTSSNVKSVSHIAELSVTYKVNPSVSFSAGVIQQFEPSNLQFKNEGVGSPKNRQDNYLRHPDFDRTNVYVSGNLNTSAFESKKSSEGEVEQMRSNSKTQEDAIMEKLKKITSLSAAVKTDLGTLAMLKVVRSLDVKKNLDAFTGVGVFSLGSPYAKDVLGNMKRLKDQTQEYLSKNPSSTKHVDLLKELDEAIPELEAKLKEAGY